MRSCTLCPRECRVNRIEGETGFCGLGPGAVLARALPHIGEEPPISGTAGAGTLFFTSCNLKCPFCQNYQISRDRMGEMVDRKALAGVMLELAMKGCHNIELVTPTPQLAAALESLLAACEWGLQLPLVYNCGGYEKTEVIRLLDGIVDVWLPDFKYGNEREARECSAPEDYAQRALESISEMIRQTGERLQTAAVSGEPLFGRRVTREEYETVVDLALDLEFENLFIQEVDDQNLVPDFNKAEPFKWD
jgi:putative pyruvate formate lyase activating enzyme